MSSSTEEKELKAWLGDKIYPVEFVRFYSEHWDIHQSLENNIRRILRLMAFKNRTRCEE